LMTGSDQELSELVTAIHFAFEEAGISAAVGSSFTEDHTDFVALYDKADQAMYERKRRMKQNNLTDPLTDR